MRSRQRPDTSAMGCNHAMTDGQAKTAAMGAAITFATGKEHVEDLASLAFGNAGAFIGNRNNELFLVPPGPDAQG